MKPPTDKRPELSVCPKNEGKTCLSLNECADSAILTNSVSSSFLDIRESGLVDLDAEANLCPVDNQVCCTPQQGNLSRGIAKKNVKFVYLCFLLVTHLLEGNKRAQNCSLFEYKSFQKNIFLT